LCAPALRRATGFPLDDLTFVVRHFLPHLTRDSIYRILRAEGLGRLPAQGRPRRGSGTFKDYDLGFVHIDVKHLPKLRTTNGESRKRFLFVAIDRGSRSVHLAVKEDETEASAVAFLKQAVAAFPFKLTHVLPDRGSCFTADGFEAACRSRGWSTGRRGPTRHKPMVSRSASTAVFSVRWWGSRSPATGISSTCFMASIRPTMPGASAC
jgi:hypothetical protein